PSAAASARAGCACCFWAAPTSARCRLPSGTPPPAQPAKKPASTCCNPRAKKGRALRPVPVSAPPGRIRRPGGDFLTVRDPFSPSFFRRTAGKEARDAAQGGRPHRRKDDAGPQRAAAAQKPAHKVELEQAHQPPVD